MPEIMMDRNGGTPKEKMGRQRGLDQYLCLLSRWKVRLLRKSSAKYVIGSSPEIAEEKTKAGEVFVKLLPKTANKDTFCEAVKVLLGEKSLVPSPERSRRDRQTRMPGGN